MLEFVARADALLSERLAGLLARSVMLPVRAFRALVARSRLKSPARTK